MEHSSVADTTRADHAKDMHSAVSSASYAGESTHPCHQLQQRFGNRTLGHLIQAKLQVNEPGDAYEQEADRVADQVMRMPEPTAQRKCAACESGSGECDECGKERVQRKAQN